MGFKATFLIKKGAVPLTGTTLKAKS